MEAWAIPAAALIVSLSTLVFAAISLKGKTGNNHTESLDRRIDRLERRNGELEEDLGRCERDRVRLMGQLVNRPNTD